MIFAVLLALQAPVVTDTLPRWRAELGAGVDIHTHDRTTWSQERAALGYRWGGTVVLADVWNAERFDVTDQGGGVEIYLRPGARTGLYLRADAAPDAEVLQRSGATVAITRGVGGGWEWTAHYRRMTYTDDAFDLYGGGAGLYKGRWYLRGDLTIVPHDGVTGGTVAFAARRYGRSGDPDDLVELRAHGGNEVTTLGPGVPPDLRRTIGAALWGQRVLSGGWGLRGTLGWTSEELAPARTSLGVAVFRKW